MKRIVVGIAGLFGSGKSTASDIFTSYDFKKVELSSFLITEAEKRGLVKSRKNLQDLGDEFRENHGSGYLMEMALRKNGFKKIVIDGIRNPSEVEVLKKKGGILIAIICDRNIRFERVKKSEKHKNITKKQIDSLDLRDLGINEKISGLQTGICIALADYFIDSNCTYSHFKSKIEEFIKEHAT